MARPPPDLRGFLFKRRVEAGASAVFRGWKRVYCELDAETLAFSQGAVQGLRSKLTRQFGKLKRASQASLPGSATASTEKQLELAAVQSATVHGRDVRLQLAGSRVDLRVNDERSACEWARHITERLARRTRLDSELVPVPPPPLHVRAASADDSSCAHDHEPPLDQLRFSEPPW